MGRQWKGTRNELMEATWEEMYGRNWMKQWKKLNIMARNPVKNIEETVKELGSNQEWEGYEKGSYGINWEQNCTAQNKLD